ncbi:MAG: hypothetical protein R3F18_17620 [Lysobacterales bacterium]|nr:hypothetical protein [Xanthomonadales bacterium]MCB1611158.1 hypothetical protein [Xanthomonadales bacterium]MCP5475298.1 hypothetical protein [Rhodanobacteraceae bacterium]
MAPNLVGDDALPPGWTAAARRHLLAGDIALARGLQPEALDHFPLGLARLLQAGLSDHPPADATPGAADTGGPGR